METQSAERMLFAEEAARRLTLSMSTLRRMRVESARCAPGERTGPVWVRLTDRRVAYPESALNDYIAACARGDGWRW